MNQVLTPAAFPFHRPIRIPFLRPVHIRVGKGPAPLQRLFSADLSRGGIFIRTPKPLPSGTPVEVFLEARGKVLRFARGEVRHELALGTASRKGRLPGFGVKFIGLSARSRALIDHLLHEASNTRVDPLADTAQRIEVPAAEAAEGAAGREQAPRRGRRFALAMAFAMALGAGAYGVSQTEAGRRIVSTARH